MKSVVLDIVVGVAVGLVVAGAIASWYFLWRGG